MKKVKKEGKNKHIHHWNYKHIIIFILSLVIAILILKSHFLAEFISKLGAYDYLGALIAGFFFAFTFTLAPATAALLIMGQTSNPILIGLVGAIGATLSHLIIFIYFKDEMPKEITYLAKKIGFDKLKHLKNTKISWLIPVIAGIIFATPLPDELGDYIFEVAHYSVAYFLIYSYIFSAIGLTVIAFLG